MIEINLNPRKKKRELTTLTPSISLKSLRFENVNKFLAILLPVILIVGLLFYYFYLGLKLKVYNKESNVNHRKRKIKGYRK
jgi:hypothetical protein